MEAPPIGEEETQRVFDWLTTIAFSRPPKNIGRDFSDGVLMAEIMRHHYPHLVQLHNYQPSNSSASKFINWKTLNQKIFKKLGFQISRSDIENIIACTPGIIERVLHFVYARLLQTELASQTQPMTLANKLSQISSPGNAATKMKSIEEENKNSFAKQLSAQLADKQRVIKELRQTIQILETKMKKMEQLSKLKDAKIDSLMKKLDEGIGI